MTVDLKQKFKNLENIAEMQHLKQEKETQERLAKLEKQEKDIKNITNVLDNLFNKSHINEFIFIQKDFNFERKPCFHSEKATWTFTLKKYNKDADLILSVNEYFDIKLAVKEIPNPDNVFYIISENDSYKFAKVPYKATYMYNRSSVGYLNHNFHIEYDFKHIDKSEVKWLSSVDELIDSVLVEIANLLEKKLK